MTDGRIRSIGVAANLMKEEALALLRELVPELLSSGFDVRLDEDLSGHFPTDGAELPLGIADDVDLVVAVGGDGTILKHARRFLEKETPILGVKGGSLGFLTEGRTDRIVEWLRDGRFHVQRRMRITALIYRGDELIRTFDALNDIVVHGAGYSRMVVLHIEIDGKELHERSADGMIVATPTGSTAYSLSAGGPLLEPTIEAIVLTPLNPHTLSFRPVVIDAEQTVSIKVSSGRTETLVTVDGQSGSRLERGEQLRIGRSAYYTRLMVPDDYDFFALLNEKL
jgi:NAD+ kinase